MSLKVSRHRRLRRYFYALRDRLADDLATLLRHELRVKQDLLDRHRRAALCGQLSLGRDYRLCLYRDPGAQLFKVPVLVIPAATTLAELLTVTRVPLGELTPAHLAELTGIFPERPRPPAEDAL